MRRGGDTGIRRRSLSGAQRDWVVWCGAIPWVVCCRVQVWSPLQRRSVFCIWNRVAGCRRAFEGVGVGKPSGPITSSEVRKRVKKRKPGGAAGPDGVKKEGILGLRGHGDLLADLFNLLSYCHHYPRAWKEN